MTRTWQAILYLKACLILGFMLGHCAHDAVADDTHAHSLSEPLTGPEMVLGTEDGAYKLFTPSEVVEAGGGGGGGGGGGAGLSDNTPQNIGTAAPGTGTLASRDDHVHGPDPQTGTNSGRLTSFGATLNTVNQRSSANTSAISTLAGKVPELSDSDPASAGTADAGSSDEASRGDHVHSLQPLSSFGTVGANGTCAKSDGSGGLRYGDCGSPRVLSNTLPKVDGSAAPGTSVQASRGDHVHPSNLSDRTPAPTGAAPDAGTATSAARGDHIHQTTLSLLAPKPNAATATAGNGSAPAPWNHVHPFAGNELPAPSSSLQGDIPRVKSDGSGYELVDPHVAVLSGFPAVTGNAGKVLAVNSTANNVEWVTQGGGSGGGGIAVERITLLENKLWTISSTQFSYTMTDEEAEKVNDAIRDTSTICLVMDNSFTSGIGSNILCEIDTTEITAAARGVAGTITTARNMYNPSVTVRKRNNVFTTKTVNVSYTGTQPTNAAQFDLVALKIVGSGGGGGNTPEIPNPSGAGNYLRVAPNGTSYELGELPFSDVVPLSPFGSTGRAGLLKGISRADHRHPRDAQIGLNQAQATSNQKGLPPVISTSNRGQYLRVKSNAPANSGVSGMEWAPIPQVAQASNAAPPSIEGGTSVQGRSNRYARQDHNHGRYSGFIEMFSGQWTLNNNNVDLTFNSAAMHNYLKATDAPKVMQIIIRYAADSLNFAYMLTCPGADTPLGNAEGRDFVCFGWRERTNDAITAVISVTPSAWRIKVNNIDARGNTRVNYKIWGQR